MTDDEVHSALVRWLAAKTSVTVIKTHQDGKAPTLPYIAVNRLGSRPVRTHERKIEYTDGNSGNPPPVTATPIIEVEWRFSVHVYGDNATDILRPIRSAAKVSQVTEPLLPLLSIRAGEIRNVPDWVNERWEPRGQMDIDLRGLTHDGFEVDVIEESPVEFERTH